MMKIKMLKTFQGAEDGIHVKTYECDKVYELAESLGTVFLSLGVAAVVEEKAVYAPANKAACPEENKIEEQEEIKERKKRK